MAAITPQVTTPGARSGPIKVFWEQINQDDTGDDHTVVGGLVVGSIHFSGTFDTGTYTLEGSMDGSDYDTVKDINGNDVTASAEANFNLACSFLYLRIANDANGTTEDVDVRLHYSKGV